MIRVLVTGASGFIGNQALHALLESDCKIHVAGRRQIPEQEEVIFHPCNLLDEKAVEGLLTKVEPSHLLHAAWYTEHGEYWHARENFFWQSATENLARKFFEIGGKRIVFVGSCAVYDWSSGDLQNNQYSEDQHGEPITNYGVTKKGAAKAIAERADAANGQSVDARIFFPMGERESRKRFLPSIICSLLRGEEAKMGPAGVRRDVMDVRDVGRALSELVHSKITGAVNIGSGRADELSEIARIAAEKIGRPELLRVGSLPPRPGDPMGFFADVTRLRKEIGFEPIYNLHEMVDSAIRWWRASDSVQTKR